MPSWRSVLALVCRLGSFALVLVLFSEVFRASRVAGAQETAGRVGLALTLLGIVAGVVVLQVASVMLDLAQNREDRTPSRTFEAERRRPPWHRIAFGVGLLLLFSFGVPTLIHRTASIKPQAVVSCESGFAPRWYIHVVLERGAMVPLHEELDPSDDCIAAGTSFEKRRWEEGYWIGGRHVMIKPRLAQPVRFFIPLGIVLVVAGVYGWAQSRRAR